MIYGFLCCVVYIHCTRVYICVCVFFLTKDREGNIILVYTKESDLDIYECCAARQTSMKKA